MDALPQPEFRNEAQKFAECIEVAAEAQELSLHESQLYASCSKKQQQMTSSGCESELAAENARLKRQLAEQAEENIRPPTVYSLKGRDIFREATEMKHVFIEQHRLNSALNQCAGCFGAPAVAGMHAKPPACAVRDCGRSHKEAQPGQSPCT